MRIAELQSEAYRIAEEHGFHDARTENATALALIHSEVSEALEADRDEDIENYGEELADIVIRVADHAEELGIDLQQEVVDKMNENEKRDHKHGRDY